MPPAAERLRRWNATSGSNLATFTLMGINIAVFVIGTIASGAASLGRSGGVDSFHQRWALVLPAISDGQYWRLITSGFLHFGILHLAMNMLALFQLGRILESSLGQFRFVGVYFASLLAGSAMVLLLQRNGQQISYTAGASGAIFGLLGCLALGMRARGISVMRSGIGATLLINLFITFGIPGISIGGHIGGLIGGAICGAILMSPRPIVSKQLAQLTPLLVGVASVVLAIAVSR